MRNWLAKFRISPWLLRKMLMLLALAGVGTAAFCWGRWQNARATPPAINGNKFFEGSIHPVTDTDYGRRVVAYIYGNVAISREELGEYLIARFGKERLEFLVNRRIVEAEAARLKITVSDGEVEARFKHDLDTFGTPITEKDFVNTILRRFNKSLYEWKEDVIRPKVMMEKIVRPMVKASLTDKDLREGFEARFGPKVQCRMIVLENGAARPRQETLDYVRKGPEKFLEKASKQAIPNLASLGGAVPPIHKHFGDRTMEQVAFSLKEGEVSPLFQLQDQSWVILLCEKHLPASLTARFEDERFKLATEMEELRVAQKIPEVFKEMHQRATPKLLLGETPSRSASISVAPPPTLAGESAVKEEPITFGPSKIAPLVPQDVKVAPLPSPPPVGVVSGTVMTDVIQAGLKEALSPPKK